MTPNPILKVLSTFRNHNVKCLLIGGQACIIYGAIEFSRDSDFIILVTKENIKNLKKALGALKAKLIYVPPLEIGYLERGHACHFRCRAKDVEGLRVDIIAKMRGCDSFDNLWKRRKTVMLKNRQRIDIIGLEDLVQSKKTQRDKDWLMLGRLVEDNIIENKKNPSAEKLKWRLLQARNADTLVALAKKYPKIAKDCVVSRPLLLSAVKSDIEKLQLQLRREELIERQKDIEYWQPLRKELERLRHGITK